ncbi:MAG TPA: alpha/beta hydrolase [Rhodopila sp.]|uniref:alpha/beta fold hydrolase n=1 Tax=Rhodopila sp. TaxID=2480087 RepID=UPI002D1E2D66|nr:alpha/beta hydrolase [Rhodopila sp.]HVY17599.1 alpha/beta hydrolase [Rhodopila sp.]
MTEHIGVSGVDLEIIRQGPPQGTGRPLLFLHPGEGLQPDRPWLAALARRFHVVAPFHPGFGGSALPDWVGSVDDLAYLYLDLAAQLGLKDALLVGNSFGGWIAAEMAVRNTARFAGLLLADPLGIKVGGVLDRDIVDMHATARADLSRLGWADPAKAEIDYAKLSDIELAGIARGREALAVFGWKPYMHNPRLKRWLHRIDIPTHLVWGEQDRIIAQPYVEAWKAEIPGASFETLPGAGHYPHLEQPDAFASRVEALSKRLG